MDVLDKKRKEASFKDRVSELNKSEETRPRGRHNQVGKDTPHRIITVQ